MKSRILLLVLAASLTVMSCKKDSPDNSQAYQIAGLWIGTYHYAKNPEAKYYFSFTVYPDGSCSYKSKGANDYTFYANGNWMLTGDQFSYTVTTTNVPGGVQSTQAGTATYSTKGTLTDGINTDVDSGATGEWSMKRVN